MGIANSFSGGIFLCVALLHLLPESAEIFEDYYDNKSSNSHSNVIEPHIEKHFPMSFLLTFIGYTLILMIEKIIFDSHCHNYSDDGVNDEIVGDDEASRLNTTNFKEFNSISKNTNAYGNYNLSINNYFDTNSKRNKFLPTVEENNFDKYKTKNNIEKAKTSILSSSIRDSFSKASKTFIINNYFNNFKSNSLEKKEEYFKNIFTTSGRISTLLIVNDHKNKIAKIKENNRCTTADALKIKELLIDSTVIDPTDANKNNEIKKQKDNITSYLLLLALSIHALFEGIAIGLQESSSQIFYMLLAISFHKWVEALSIGININNSNIEKKYKMKFIILFSLMTPIGMILGIFFSGFSMIVEAVFLSMSAGSFIYISSSEIVIEEFSISNNKKEKFIAFVLGSLIVSILTFFGEHNH